MPDSLLGLVLAQEAPAAPSAPAEGGEPAPGGGLMGSLPLLLIIFGIFYFLMIRPQSKERRKREEMMRALKKHDQIVTTAGIHGEVVSLSETTVTVRVDDGVRLTFDRSAIWQVRRPAGGGEDPAPAESGDGRPEKASERAAEKGKDAREKGKA